MPKIEYVSKRFRSSSLQTIREANSIISEYQNDGYDLTLRQLYYQFVSRGLIPNKDSEYKKLGSVINDARLAGLIDWDAIVDRTRTLRGNSSWENPQEIIESCAAQFRLNTRATQNHYLEVWVEKDALIGVLETACVDLDVKYFSCRGYVSQSAMWRAAQRIAWKKNPIILHLGDHDPSGIDMTRDIQDRLNLFGCPVNVKRIALNMDQVKEHSPPPNPAKTTDSRYYSYIAEYGDESWELDALDPRTITELIKGTAGEYTDENARDVLLTEQTQHRQDLQSVADNWEQLI